MSITELVTTKPRRQAAKRRPAVTLSKFPAIEPGQLWLIEAAAGDALSACARHAVDGANVVIYDGALAGTLANALPLGTYAEAGERTD